MAYESWIDVVNFFKRQIPDLFLKRRLNFITIHYLYMIGMTLLLSVIIYGIGGLSYTNALFFASGACTQSGLNTVDINLLHTGQQATLYTGAMFCNPIVIHSFVVFVRLYWFEKRFKDVVREARALRRTKTKSRNTTMEKEDPERGSQEPGVRGRGIDILKNTGRFGRIDETNENEASKAVESSDDGSKANGDVNHENDNDNDNDQVELSRTKSTDEEVRLPQQLSPEQHIRFLEQQRNPSQGGALRIPSPREFERGGRPESVEDLAAQGIMRRVTTNLDATGESHSDQNTQSAPRVSHHITINEPEIHRDRDKTSTFPRQPSRQRTQPQEGEEPRPLSQTRHRRTNTFSSFRRTNTGRSMEPAPYLSYEPTIGRNSFFVNLTEDQREELGGIEYRALKTLAMVLVLYFVCFHLLGVICLTPWITQTANYGKIVAEQGQGRVWWGIFTGASLFNDLGFTLTNNSMISFQDALFPLLLGTFLIVIGNTGFPCMLRFCIWAASSVVPIGSGVWEELQFLLDHPRRCFTLLFPRGATWWLFSILCVLNGLDIIFFIILDLKDPAVTSLPPGLRFVNGLFQAASTRTAGFSVVNLAELHPAIQVSYLIMMYISVFPIAISMRRTNVYEEKSLGIYANSTEDEDGGGGAKEPSYVAAHLRKQLSFDLWYVFLGLFIIAIIEGNRLENTNEYAFTLFSVLFEIVSAYGTVGLSLGYPTTNTSFSGEFKTLSKLVIIAMQIRGRHRGLPYELDRAVLLPSESLHAKEAKEGQRLQQRRRSSVGTIGTMSAVDGQVEGIRFRPETGISSGLEQDTRSSHDGLRAVAAAHKSRARQGLGEAMFKLASAPDAIKRNFTSQRRGAVS